MCIHKMLHQFIFENLYELVAKLQIIPNYMLDYCNDFENSG